MQGNNSSSYIILFTAILIIRITILLIAELDIFQAMGKMEGSLYHTTHNS